MRKDMAKVVTEAPRHGSSNPSRKWALRLPTKDIPSYLQDRPYRDLDELSFEGYWDEQDTGPRTTGRWTRQYGYDKKSFSDVLGPLRRYLRKQVGRPWNEVWSELSANLDKRSVTGSHIFDHIKQEVILHTFRDDDGQLYHQPKYWNKMQPVEGFYVDDGGFLRYTQRSGYRRQWFKDRPRQEFQKRLAKFPGCETTSETAENYRIGDDWTVWEKIRGCWFIRSYQTKDPMTVIKTERLGDRYKWQLDHARRFKRGAEEIARLERLYADDTTILHYLGPGYKELIDVRQASRKEIRAHRTMLETRPW